MHKKEIIKRLANTRLEAHERETLSQLLHYLEAEGLTYTSTSSNKPKHKHTPRNTAKK